ncbi:MAG TPA: hypothetical protein VEP93_12885 [Variovorax sp.]|nr:hypothetical protein [Variovorax sp.]
MALLRQCLFEVRAAAHARAQARDPATPDAGRRVLTPSFASRPFAATATQAEPTSHAPVRAAPIR